MSGVRTVVIDDNEDDNEYLRCFLQWKLRAFTDTFGFSRYSFAKILEKTSTIAFNLEFLTVAASDYYETLSI